MGGSDYPKLRWPIDVRIENFDGESVLLLQCPAGIGPAPLGLSPAVAPILSVLEGNTSRDDIVRRFADRGLTLDLLDELLRILDEHYFLANSRFFAEEKRIKDAFAESSVRPPALAGRSYSLDAVELGREIDGYLAHGSPGTGNGRMIGVMAPHIDYRRGQTCYGLTYARLHNRPEDVFILIGTSHQYSTRLFHLTAKDFASPLGTISCDVEFVTKLAGRFSPQRAFADEFLHRKEHSLELQIPFLARLRPNAKIIPILVGGFHQMVSAGRLPEEVGEYNDFAGALSECIREYQDSGRNVCILAGVDMAHIGRSFGDEGALSPEIMATIQVMDSQYLAAIYEQDKRKLFDHVASDQDARRICGFPTMYTVLDVFDRLNIRYDAELIDYRQAVNYQTDCAVTFAGMTFMQRA